MDTEEQTDFTEPQSPATKPVVPNTDNKVTLPAQEPLQKKYSQARNSLLSVIILTVINIILILVNASLYFPFSAWIPLIFAGSGKEFLTDQGDRIAFACFIVIAIVLTIPFVVCYFCSKKRYGWLIAALVLFIIDTLLLLFAFSADSIIDLIFHVWVIISLSGGIIAGKKLRKLEAESASPPQETGNPPLDLPQDIGNKIPQEGSN